mmetsp:Transcript_13830/g.20544  ORF Transcript_13830/g.20544 Transcript_13830/m.20544 type:complete len:192 (+) Transcript_13830:36-611(+)|eukprot:CAMPEP_0171455312 /NCGR_PEP_ID=MMETSP0945-20130129/2256_1 /TAXON_ID=109269 /ORGANISM="Vaucheria litorea, Strain CCMP2940" /LENGTH=191 /DNA_ID=CAMNT_0011980525 /DNA_START=20 /DNA_END=595 /DNA_ORIENTATION=-
MSTLCTRATKLLEELGRSTWLASYDEVGVSEILREIREKESEINYTLSLADDSESLPESVRIGLAMHHSSLLRNKRCLLAYVNRRATLISEMYWDTGSIIPEDKVAKLSQREIDFFFNYDKLVSNYVSDVGFDLASDIRPPKDIYVEVRSLVGDKNMETASGKLQLQKGAYYLIKRTDANSFIQKGLIEEI